MVLFQGGEDMSDTTENIYIIDWLTFSCKHMDPDQMISFLGLKKSDFIDVRGFNGYKSAIFFGGITVLSDGHIDKDGNDMGICVNMSGQGCRQYETSGLHSLDWLAHFLAKNSDKFNISRLDVAFDDVDHEGDGLLDMSVIEELARSDVYVSRFRSKSGEWSAKHSEDADVPPLAISVYFGSPRSDVRFRLYDKSKERGGLDYHWTRFEIQLRNDACLNFLLDPHSVGERFYGLINNYLRFVVPDLCDSNRRRWKSPKWWTDFLQSSLKISVFTKKGVDYNMTKLEHFVYDQAGLSIFTVIKCKGPIVFMQDLRERIKDKQFSDKQLKVISEWSATKEERELFKKPKGTTNHPEQGN